MPFKASNMSDLHKLITKGSFSFPIDITEEASELIKRMLTLNVDDRISVPEVLSHPWVQDNTEDLGEFEDMGP